MRIAFEQLTIFERAGFGFVTIDHDEGGPLRREKIPFLRSGERAPSASPREPGGAHLGEHLGRGQIGDRSAKRA